MDLVKRCIDGAAGEDVVVGRLSPVPATADRPRGTRFHMDSSAADVDVSAVLAAATADGRSVG